MFSFGNVVTAMISPFAADGSVNYAMAERLASHLVERGSDAIVVCGTTGESPTLKGEEKYELFRVVRQAVSGKAQVIAGTGSNATSEAVAATQKVARLGIDGCLSVVPYYNKPNPEGLYRHFEAIARSSPDLPIVLYNIPGRTGQNLPSETVARLAEIPNIVAIKEASGNLDRVSQIRRLTSPEFLIYAGDDSLTLPILAVGGTGVVSVASHLAGDRIQQMVAAFHDGKPQVSLEIHLQLLPLFKALFLTTNPIPLKAALSLLGWDVGVLRLPLCEASEEITISLKAILKDLQLL